LRGRDAVVSGPALVIIVFVHAGLGERARCVSFVPIRRLDFRRRCFVRLACEDATVSDYRRRPSGRLFRNRPKIITVRPVKRTRPKQNGRRQ